MATTEFFSSKVIEIMLYMQTTYDVWVFIRTTKFFKLPYIMVSSLWHDGPAASLPFKRKVGLMVHDGPSIEECKKYNGLFATVRSGHRSIVTYSESGRVKRLIVDDTDLHDVVSLNSMMVDTIFTKSRDLLLPRCSLVKQISKSEVFQLFLDGYKPEVYEENCFIDQSSGKELNKDFVKLISVVPIYLQAKNKNNASIIAFLLIVLFNFLSYFPNLLWQHLKKNVFYYSKLLLAKMSLKVRKFVHVFLSTISHGFMYSDFSIHKAYHTEARELYVVEPCLLPSYVEDVMEVDHGGASIANKDGKVHVFEFMVNLNKHVTKYKYEGRLNATFRVEHLLNGVVIALETQIEEDIFEADLSFFRDVSRMGIYPVQVLMEDGLQLIVPKTFHEELYPFRGLKVIVKKGIFV